MRYVRDRASEASSGGQYVRTLQTNCFLQAPGFQDRFVPIQNLAHARVASSTSSNALRNPARMQYYRISAEEWPTVISREDFAGGRRPTLTLQTRQYSDH